METLIEKKIQEFTADAEKVQEIEKGSDQHLDEISAYVRPLDSMTFILARLNQNLRNIFNTDSDLLITDNELKLLEEVKGITGKLYVGFKSAKYSCDFTEALSRFDQERQSFKEIAHDLREFRTNSKDRDDLLNILNSL